MKEVNRHTVLTTIQITMQMRKEFILDPNVCEIVKTLLEKKVTLLTGTRYNIISLTDHRSLSHRCFGSRKHKAKLFGARWVKPKLKL